MPAPEPNEPLMPQNPESPWVDPQSPPKTPNALVIGTFTAQGDRFEGKVNTLAMKAPVTVAPLQRQATGAPDFVVSSDGIALGYGFRGVTGDAEHVRIHMDDPSFAAPITAYLVPSKEAGQHHLVWARR